tara:strand:- start:52 stop:222 length:171 start_codon:yes stop_codon:yes gene_type:complete
MKSFFLILMIFSLSSCAVASLTKTAVTTAVKVVEVPFNLVGSILSEEEEEEAEDEQ